MGIICKLFGHRFYEEGFIAHGVEFAPYIPKQCPRCSVDNPRW